MLFYLFEKAIYLLTHAIKPLLAPVVQILNVICNQPCVFMTALWAVHALVLQFVTAGQQTLNRILSKKF